MKILSVILLAFISGCSNIETNYKTNMDCVITDEGLSNYSLKNDYSFDCDTSLEKHFNN